MHGSFAHGIDFNGIDQGLLSVDRLWEKKKYVGKKCDIKLSVFALCRDDILKYHIRDHPFKTSACLRGGGVSLCADGQKVTVHRDQKSPS